MLRKILISAITLAIPFLLVVANIRIVANPWFIQFEYGRPGFPADAYGFTPEQRTPLALAGLYVSRAGRRGADRAGAGETAYWRTGLHRARDQTYAGCARVDGQGFPAGAQPLAAR